jgi:hypothetical protein
VELRRGKEGGCDQGDQEKQADFPTNNKTQKRTEDEKIQARNKCSFVAAVALGITESDPLGPIP